MPKLNTVHLILGVLLAVGVLAGSHLTLVAQTVDHDELREWRSRDSDTTCDEIGWDAGEIMQGSPDDDDIMHHAACVGSVAYIAICGTIDGDGMFFEPSANELWVACFIRAAQMSDGESSVSPFDFSLVSAEGRKHDQDFTAQATLDPGAMFPTETLREGQLVEGIIAFSVPKTADLPFSIEIDPLLDFSFSGADPGNIIIPKLVPMRSLIS